MSSDQSRAEGDNFVVWKFEMATARAVFDMPEGAEVLSVGYQNGNVVIWAEVNPSNPTERRIFNALNTGMQLPGDRMKFYGTVQCQGAIQDYIVWHIYEVKR